jgi:hypothetical protein
VFCFVFLLPLSSIAQHQPVPSDPGIELTPSDKFHHVLQQIAAHNDSDKLPDTWQAAFEKLNSDFPIHKALGRSYHKESIDVWLQRSSSSFHEHYAFFCDYLNQLDSQK